MKNFTKGEIALFFNGSDSFAATVIDTEHAPFYMIQPIRSSEGTRAAAECDLFKYTADGLRAARLEIKQRINVLVDLVDEIDHEIDRLRIEGDNASI